MAAAVGGNFSNSLDAAISARPQREVSLSAFAFLFSEIVNYSQNRSLSVDDMQRRLEHAGRGVGHKMLELQCWREKQGKLDGKRINKREDLLTFISTNMWKAMFGKSADSLERSTNSEEEYMIYEAGPITNQFISVPADMGNFNCAAYLAGIISGMLESANFPAKVTAVDTTTGDEGGAASTVYLIEFT
jgi:hypothetical protein